MAPHIHAEPDAAEPTLGLQPLVPRAGGLQRLLAKRAERARRAQLQDWLPAAACAASLLMMVASLRGPGIDLEEVRSQLTARGTTLQLQKQPPDAKPVVLEPRSVAAGVYMYSVQAAAPRAAGSRR